MVIIDVRRFEALIFDLDGVITQTASIHARAWKQLFDEFLSRRAAQTGAPPVPFDLANDYRRYVDGKPRIAGVVSFLAARSITVPMGAAEDQARQETAHGLASRKDQYFTELLRHVHLLPPAPFCRRPADAACAPLLRHRVTIARKFSTLPVWKRYSMSESTASILIDFDLLGSRLLTCFWKPRAVSTRLLRIPQSSRMQQSALKRPAPGVSASGVAPAARAPDLLKQGADDVVDNLGEVRLEGTAHLR
jgi:hypothetical protein